MNPPIITLSPVCTKARVLMLPSCDVGPGAQYLPPVFRPSGYVSHPPQTSIWLPVQTAVASSREAGASAVLVAVQLFVLGSYLPPVLVRPDVLDPPQTIISLSVQTAVWRFR